MPLKQVDLTGVLSKIEFAVPDFFPVGYLNFLGAREGVGKTTLLTGLLWQMSRPHGGEWLGMAVGNGATVYVNTDAPDGSSRPVRYWLEKHRSAFPDGDLSKIMVLEPTGAGLSLDDLNEIEKLAMEKKAKVIIIDSYMGAFPGFDGNKLEQALIPVQAVRDMAARTGAAVIVTDHLPKRAAGEKDGDRGIMGSVGKQAQARAVVLMTRIPPNECEGKNAVKIEVTKQSFAQRMVPFGVEIRVDANESGEDIVLLETFDLPEEQTNTGKYKAKDAVLNMLKLKSGQWVLQADLVQVAIARGNLRDRQARAAVRDALDELRKILKDDFEEGIAPGRGGKKQYRIKQAVAPPDHTESGSSCDDPELFGTLAAIPPAVLPECQSSENTVPDNESFVAMANCQSSQTAIVPTEFEDRDIPGVDADWGD
jgi:AAA domain